MGTEQKVAVITGASQGIGAGLVQAFRDRGYSVIANSRTIKPSNDPDILTIAGDIADRQTWPSASSAKAWPGSAASTPSSTMPASSLPSRSPTTPRMTIRRCCPINVDGFFNLTQGQR